VSERRQRAGAVLAERAAAGLLFLLVALLSPWLLRFTAGLAVPLSARLFALAGEGSWPVAAFPELAAVVGKFLAVLLALAVLASGAAAGLRRLS
jgi:hypothetical protein